MNHRLSVLQAHSSAATHNVSPWGDIEFPPDSDSMCVCVCLSRVAFSLWSFTVRWCREGGILVIVWLPANLYVHRSMGRVNGWGRVAIESAECVMRNVDAQREKRERDGERKRGYLPTTFLQHLPRGFSSPAQYQHPSQSAARGKINFLLPDYIIRFRLECHLNIPHQHFIKQGYSMV